MDSSDKKYYWIKIKDDFITSDKVDYLMSQKNGAEYVLLYQLLCLKCINTDGLLARKIGEVIIPFDAEKIARDCKYFSIDTVRQSFLLFKQLGMVYVEENGYLRITDFENMVGGSKTDEHTRRLGAERQAKFRARKSLESCDNSVTVTDDVTLKRNGEIRDKEIRDKDINLNTHNIINNIYTDNSEKETCACSEPLPETENNNFNADYSFSEPQQNYARQVFELYRNAGLPCGNGNIMTFMSRDFAFGINNLRRLRIGSTETIQAIKNYISVIELQKTNSTWWDSKQSFNAFTEKQILNFLPGTFDINHYLKKKDSEEKPKVIKNKTSYVDSVMSKDPRFSNEIFEKYYDDWCDSGRPIDEDYFTWQKKFEGAE